MADKNYKPLTWVLLYCQFNASLNTAMLYK
jgi:hypothetical protein